MLQRTAILLAFSILHSSCYHADPLFCSEDKPCTDSELPFCDKWGAYEASNMIANTCIPQPDKVYCPQAKQQCASDVETSCAAGEFEQTRACPSGCHPTEQRCSEVAPSNELYDFLEMAKTAPAVALLSDATINLDNTISTEFETITVPSFEVTQNTDHTDIWRREVPLIRVLVVSSWESKNVEIKGPYSVAIVSYGEILLNGEFHAGYSMAESGNCEQNVPNDIPLLWCEKGAAGGSAYQGDGGIGDSTYHPAKQTTDNSNLVPLMGGCGYSSAKGVQFVSRTKITIDDGFINAAGFGAHGPFGCMVGAPKFSAPGGAGGGVLIEAPEISITGSGGITANGGSGGCEAKPGTPGALSYNAVPGAVCDNGAQGGSGSSFANLNGGDGTTVGESTGGGGGGAGYIRINVLNGNYNVDPAAIITPAPSIGQLQLR